MKKVIVSLASLESAWSCAVRPRPKHTETPMAAVPLTTAEIPPRGTSHGGSATHTAGQGTTASNAYGGSAYHAQYLERRLLPTVMVPPRTPRDREPALLTHTALPIMRKGLEPRLRPTTTAAARHITPDTAPLLRIPMARQLMHIIRPLPIMHIIHRLPRPTTEHRATTAALARLRVPPLPAL